MLLAAPHLLCLQAWLPHFSAGAPHGVRLAGSLWQLFMHTADAWLVPPSAAALLCFKAWLRELTDLPAALAAAGAGHGRR